MSGPLASDSTAGPRYVLVAEGDFARAAWCLEALKPLGLGVLVARDGKDVRAMLQQFGAPVLLVIALSLPDGDGVAVIRAVRHLAGPDTTAIIAITSLGSARLPLEARNVFGVSAVLPSTASLDALRDVISNALKAIGVSARRESLGADGREHAQEIVDRTVRDLAEEATHLTGVPGAVVYVKAGPYDGVRAHVNWVQDDVESGSPFSLPYVFERVLETGAPLVLPNLATAIKPLLAPTSTLHDVVRGLVAVPLVGRTGRVLGTVCVFDVKPLAIGIAGMHALQALGHRVGEVIEALAPASSSAGSKNGTAMSAEAADPNPPDARAADPLTEVPTAQNGRAIIAGEVARARDRRSPLSLLLVGVDDVTGIEPRQDRAAADRVLRAINQEVRSLLRRSDFAFKWSDDAFLIGLPATSVKSARDVAARILAGTPGMSPLTATSVTVSAAATEVAPGEEFDRALERLAMQLRNAGRRGGR